MPEENRQRSKTRSKHRRNSRRMRSRLAPVLNERSELPLCALVGAMVAQVAMPAPTGSRGLDVLWSLVGGALTACIMLGALQRLRAGWTPLVRSIVAISITVVLFQLKLPGQFGLELLAGLFVILAGLLIILVRWKSGPSRSKRGFFNTPSRRRYGLLVGASLVVAAIVSTAYGANTAISMRDSLRKASTLAEAAGKDLQALEFERAANKLQSASDVLVEFDSIARGRGGNILRSIPIMGYQRTYLMGVARELRELARRASDLVLRGPLQAFTAQDGRLDLSAIETLAKPLNDVVATSGNVAMTNAVASPWVWNSLTNVTTNLSTAIQSATGTLRNTLYAVEAAPLFLGNDNPQTFGIVVMSSSTRGLLGGSPVAIGRMTTRSGFVSVDFVKENYDPKGEAYVELTSSPDFQEGARRAGKALSDALGYAIDGIIAIDTEALAQLLTLTGPIQVDKQEPELTVDTLANFLNKDQFDAPGGTRSTDKTAEVAQLIFNKLKASRNLLLTELTKAWGPSVLNGNVRFWFPEFTFSQIAKAMNGLGGFADPASIADFALLARSKTPRLDSQVSRETDIDMRVDAQGKITTQVTLTLSNKELVEGETEFTLYSLTKCTAEVNGKSTGVVSTRRLLWSVTTLGLRLGSRTSETVVMNCIGSSEQEGLPVGLPRFRGQMSASGDPWKVRLVSPGSSFSFDGTIGGNSWRFLESR